MIEVLDTIPQLFVCAVIPTPPQLFTNYQALLLNHTFFYEKHTDFFKHGGSREEAR